MTQQRARKVVPRKSVDEASVSVGDERSSVEKRPGASMRGGHDPHELARRSAEARRLKREQGAKAEAVTAEQPLDALSVLQQIVNDPKVPAHARVQAASKVLAQAASTPPRTSGFDFMQPPTEDDAEALRLLSHEELLELGRDLLAISDTLADVAGPEAMAEVEALLYPEGAPTSRPMPEEQTNEGENDD
jgi:hypothetical protein